MSGRRTEGKHFEIQELSMWGRRCRRGKSALIVSAACDVLSGSTFKIGSWFLRGFGLSPITMCRMLTCLDRWNPDSARDGTTSCREW